MTIERIETQKRGGFTPAIEGVTNSTFYLTLRNIYVHRVRSLRSKERTKTTGIHRLSGLPNRMKETTTKTSRRRLLTGTS